jgi:hypothetical protein
MSAQLVALCFDANDPLRLARFWSEALRWDVGDESGDMVSLVPTDGTRFQIDFALVPEPKGAWANRLHLDLTTTSLGDQKETVKRLIELGGRHIDIGQGPEDEHVVLADPEGNELCIIEPTNNFLSTCGRFGSITCDGTRQVPPTAINKLKSTDFSRWARGESTSARATSIGSCWPTPTTTSSAC